MESKPRNYGSRKSPENAKKHDVGDGEMLTVKQIAQFLGTTDATVRQRINSGWTGESLLVPVGERRAKSRPRTNTSVIAYTLALRFKTRLPSAEEIMETYPMSEATAYYWRHTIKVALDRLADQPRRR